MESGMKRESFVLYFAYLRCPNVETCLLFSVLFQWLRERERDKEKERGREREIKKKRESLGFVHFWFLLPIILNFEQRKWRSRGGPFEFILFIFIESKTRGMHRGNRKREREIKILGSFFYFALHKIRNIPST